MSGNMLYCAKVRPLHRYPAPKRCDVIYEQVHRCCLDAHIDRIAHASLAEQVD